MNLKDFYISKIEKGNTWVKIIACIRKNKTGEIREHKDEVWWEFCKPYGEDYPSSSMWADGNYSCDCNRCLYFQRAKNESEDNCECGDELYSVNLKNPKSNEIFYKEF